MNIQNKTKKNKHILIVTDSYPPEVRSAAQLMKDMAEELASRGYKVSVITSYPRYNLAEDFNKELPTVSFENGVSVIRVKTLPHHKVNFIVRGIAQLTMPYIFFLGIARYINDPVDAVITHSPPLPLYKVGKYIKKAYGANNILNVHDIFPQNAVDLGVMNNKLILKYFERMEKKAYKTADKLVVPSKNHKLFLEQQRNIPSSKTTVVEHWLDMGPFNEAVRTNKYRKQYNLEGKDIFLFAGVLGPSQGLEMIIEAAKDLQDYKDLHFLFVGDGTAKPELQNLVRENSLDNVSFQPFVNSQEYPKLVKDCDVCLVTLTSKNTTPAVPAKLMGYMASEKPVAAFVHRESYVHQIIEKADCGVAVESTDTSEVIESLRTLYENKDQWNQLGINARVFAENHFTKEKAVDSLEQII